MAGKQVIPAPPGIFLDERPVVALIVTVNTDSDSSTDVEPLIVNTNGTITPPERKGQYNVDLSGLWK